MQSLVQYRRLGDVAGEALCLNNLGALQMDRGEHDAAAAHLRPGSRSATATVSSATRVFILANLAELAMKTGDDRLGASVCGTARSRSPSSAGNRAIVCWLEAAVRPHRLAARRPGRRAQPPRATSLDIAMAIGRPSLQLDGVSCFAEILVAQGERGLRAPGSRLRGRAPVDERAQERDDAARAIGAWGAAGARRPAWPGIELDELVHRIVVEADAGPCPADRVDPRRVAEAVGPGVGAVRHREGACARPRLAPPPFPAPTRASPGARNARERPLAYSPAFERTNMRQSQRPSPSSRPSRRRADSRWIDAPAARPSQGRGSPERSPP